MCGKYFEEKKGNHKTHTKKHKLIYDPSQRYQDSRHIFQNPKVHQSVMGLSNHAQSFTTPYYLYVNSSFKKLKKFKVRLHIVSIVLSNSLI